MLCFSLVMSLFFATADGTLFHPFIDTSETLYIFNSQFCRSVYVTYTGKKTLSDSNIPVYHFTPPKSVFASHDENPTNKGFCTPSINNCLGAGVLNISACSISKYLYFLAVVLCKYLDLRV